MNNFFPFKSNVDGLWVSTGEKTPDHRSPTGRRDVVMRDMARWDEIATEREESIRVATIWRDAAVKDGWTIAPTYAGEAQERAARLMRDGYVCQILTRPNERPADATSHAGTLGGGEVHVWGPDRLQIPVPRAYPGWQYFADALTTCPHCHRGPNREYFTDGVTVATDRATDPDGILVVPVATKAYSFAGRTCEQCAPALRATHEKPGWND